MYSHIGLGLDNTTTAMNLLQLISSELSRQSSVESHLQAKDIHRPLAHWNSSPGHFPTFRSEGTRRTNLHITASFWSYIDLPIFKVQNSNQINITLSRWVSIRMQLEFKTRKKSIWISQIFCEAKIVHWVDVRFSKIISLGRILKQMHTILKYNFKYVI